MNNIHQHEICSNQSFMSVHSIIDSRLINHILIANLLNYLDVDENSINLFLKKKALPNILSFSDDTIKSYNDDVDSILCRIPNELQKEKLNRNFIELIVLVDGLTISEIHLLTLLSEYNLEETINLIAEHISILDLMQVK
jgi:acetylglutamate kinase